MILPAGPGSHQPDSAEADVYLNPISEGTAIAKGPEQGCLLVSALSLSKTTREARLSSQGCLATTEPGKRSSPEKVSDFKTPTDARRMRRRHVTRRDRYVARLEGREELRAVWSVWSMGSGQKQGGGQALSCITYISTKKRIKQCFPKVSDACEATRDLVKMQILSQ